MIQERKREEHRRKKERERSGGAEERGGHAGVLRVEKENRAKEGEADAHSSQECKSSLFLSLRTNGGGQGEGTGPRRCRRGCASVHH